MNPHHVSSVIIFGRMVLRNKHVFSKAQSFFFFLKRHLACTRKCGAADDSPRCAPTERKTLHCHRRDGHKEDCDKTAVSVHRARNITGISTSGVPRSMAFQSEIGGAQCDANVSRDGRDAGGGDKADSRRPMRREEDNKRVAVVEFRPARSLFATDSVVDGDNYWQPALVEDANACQKRKKSNEATETAARKRHRRPDARFQHALGKVYNSSVSLTR